MVEHKKSGKGQKVTLGENAPSWQESTGKVPKDSLASESIEHGGEFSINRGVEAPSKPSKSTSTKSENRPSKSEDFTRSKSENVTKSKQTRPSKTENIPSAQPQHAPSAGSESYAQVAKAPAAEYHGESAPAHHAGPRHRRDSWPHGKNIHEGIDYKGTEDGMAKAMNAELGSEDDPSRLAELRFQKQNELRAAGDTGPRQYETVGKTPFENLEEQQA